VREEGFVDQEVNDFYPAKDLLGQWVKYYNGERLHSALNYLRLVDCYKGNSEVLLAEQRRKLKEAAASRRETNKLVDPAKTKVGGV
jgi:transposase InsO family protein